MTGKLIFKPFTQEQYALLEEMRAAGKSWTEIGEACEHTANSCSTTYCVRKRQQREGKPVSGRYVTRDLRRSWLPAEVETMLRMRDVEHKAFHDIDIALNRSTNASVRKYNQIKAEPSTILTCDQLERKGMRVAVTPAALADRDQRYQLKMQQSPIAALLGEPLPGRSALDQRDQKRDGA